MKTPLLFVLLSFGLSAEASPPDLDAMPAELETQLALASAPPALRAESTVYLLDPAKGYHVSKRGTSGLECLVERTQWELGELRDDLYVPLCYDAAGEDILRSIRDTASLRAQGLKGDAIKAEINRRWTNNTYRAPHKPGLSYMVAPLMRTIGPPDLKVRTMAMPHLMFYAPGASNKDIGAKPDLADHASLLWPFVDKQGIAEQTYFIQLIGEAEKARILRDEKPLLDALCAYRELLCVTATTAHH
jgi:hypothetical protein